MKDRRTGPRVSSLSVLSGIALLVLAGCNSSTGSNETNLPPPIIEAATMVPGKLINVGPRQSNQSCLVGDAPQSVVRLERVFENIPIAHPVHMEQVPGSPDNLFYLAEKNGIVTAFPADTNASAGEAIVALQLPVFTSGESGITGFAFHPEFTSNGLAYISYGAHINGDNLVHRLSVFERGADGVSLGNESVLIEMNKDNAEHFGGAITFGPDGYLYFTVGDDGDNLDGDLHPELAQNENSFYGSILRIDVNTSDAPLGYGIPVDNPSFSGNAPTEVWSIGFRNPWRMSFDAEFPHTAWSTDVGSRKFEEINVVSSGSNHGWPACEGPCDPSNDDYTDPIHSYEALGGAAVIGGYAYRGKNIPELYGKFVFSDYIKRDIRILDPDLLPNEPLFAQTIMSIPFSISGFAQDNNKELYALDLFEGAVYRLVRNTNNENSGPAQNLSDTGCFVSLDGGKPLPANGVVDYHINQRFWSDGASKQRQLALPDSTVIDTTDPDDWQIPAGGLAIKHFYWREKIIETRFLVRHDEKTYSGYTYAWNDTQDDAELISASGEHRVLDDGKKWEYPSRGDCLRCHSQDAGYTLSLESRQLNAVDSEGRDQIDALAEHGYLDSATPSKLQGLPHATDLINTAIPLKERAESWLHVNCSSCHRGEGSAGRATWDARYATAFEDKLLCDQLPFESVSTNPEQESLFTPGSHDLSTLWLRSSSRDTPYTMPPISSFEVDETGSALLAEWIDAYQSECPAVGDTLPGRVQAQNYTSSFDLSEGNEASSGICDRNDNTDIEPTSDQQGACVVSWTEQGEWVEFSVNVDAAGDYELMVRAASGATPNDRSSALNVRLNDDTVVTGLEIQNLGWSVYQTVSAGTLALPKGNHKIRIEFATGFVNLNYFDVR